MKKRIKKKKERLKVLTFKKDGGIKEKYCTGKKGKLPPGTKFQIKAVHFSSIFEIRCGKVE